MRMSRYLTLLLIALCLAVLLPTDVRAGARDCRELAADSALAMKVSPPGFSSQNPAEMLAGMAELGIAELAGPIEPGKSFASPLLIDGAAMTLEMKPESVRGAGFSCVVAGTDGPVRQIDPGPVPTFRGSIREIPGSVAVAVVIGNEVVLMIELPEGRRMWASLTQGPTFARGLAYVADGLGAAIDEEAEVLGRGGLPRSGPQFQLTGGGVEDCALQGLCLAEIIIDTDSGFYAGYTGTPQEIEDQIQATVQGYVAIVNVTYEQEFSITHRISQCVIRPDQGSDPYFPPPPPPTPPNPPVPSTTIMLGRMAIEWFNPPGVPPADIVHLFTTASWVTGVGGSAYVAGVCTVDFIGGMQGFTLAGGGPPSCTRAAIMMHELGHTWGASHNNPSCQGIMDNGGGVCGRVFCPPTCGSPCSRDAIEARRDQIDRTCLDLLTAVELFRDGFESGDVNAWSCSAPAMVCPD